MRQVVNIGDQCVQLPVDIYHFWFAIRRQRRSSCQNGVELHGDQGEPLPDVIVQLSRNMLALVFRSIDDSPRKSANRFIRSFPPQHLYDEQDHENRLNAEDPQADQQIFPILLP